MNTEIAAAPQSSLEETPELTEITRSGNLLYLSPDSEVATDTCICCGKRATRTVRKSLRNPKKPTTWFGKQPTYEFGLCRKHAEESSVAVALTFSVLAIGTLLLVAGAVTISPLTIVVGLLAVLTSGVFRARTPVFSPDAEEDRVAVAGVGEVYLSHYPEVAEAAE